MVGGVLRHPAKHGGRWQAEDEVPLQQQRHAIFERDRGSEHRRRALYPRRHPAGLEDDLLQRDRGRSRHRATWRPRAHGRGHQQPRDSRRDLQRSDEGGLREGGERGGRARAALEARRGDGGRRRHPEKARPADLQPREGEDRTSQGEVRGDRRQHRRSQGRQGCGHELHHHLHEQHQGPGLLRRGRRRRARRPLRCKPGADI
mmetsp:Transcript_38710/g.74329  ORF Transcript_38710/g.74329 Transcript_38710/m.74329 type:complete len:203 (-) Transcript_38710:192-800(-)